MPRNKEIKNHLHAGRKFRLIITIVAVVSWGLAFSLYFQRPTPANAHAAYVRSDPAADSSLPSGHPPQQVQVWFAENIEERFSEITVINSTDGQVDAGGSHLAPSQNDSLIVALKPGLPDGTYTVNFKSASADDGHVSQGAFTFNVGAGTGASLPIEAIENTAASTADNLNFWTISLRWLNYLMAALILGSFAFAVLVWKRSAGSLAATDAGGSMSEFETAYGRGLQRIRQLAWVGLWGLVVCWAGWVLYQSITLSGQSLAQLIGLAPGAGPQALVNLLFATRYGIVWMARLGIIFFLFDALVLLLPETDPKATKKGAATTEKTLEPEVVSADPAPPESDGETLPVNDPATDAPLETAAPTGTGKTLPRRKRPLRLIAQSVEERAIWWWSVIILSACILLTQSLTSHAASQPSLAWFTIVVDWVHLLSTSVWVGGLIALAAGLRAALPAITATSGDRARLLALVVPAFSRLALLSVAALVLTGTLNAFTEFTDPGQLFSTSYGLSLVVKIVLLGLLLGLGSYNLLVVGQRMPRYVAGKFKSQKEAANKNAARLSLHFRRSVLLEIILAVLAFLAAAFLTSNPPPRSLTQPTSGERAGQFYQQTVQLLPDTIPVVMSFREHPRTRA